jgi:hypothetical protein
VVTVMLATGAVIPRTSHAQWATTYEQSYLPGPYNWQFRHNYSAADRLFNAFDFGHAILYETLLTDFERSVPALEQTWYDRLTRDILVHPPRIPLEEAAIEINYARLVPEAKQMFDWAHLLHRQIYDVWADERMTVAARDAKVAELIRYYKTRPDLAFSSRPKSMMLMQEQPYSLAFRKGYPKFNGLIWAYHWLQVGHYEPLVTGSNVDEKQAGVRATVARFWQMLEEAPRTMPYVMPMTAAVSPAFAQRYPEAAIIFDNLHSMHDAVSDILANPTVTRDRKRTEIIRAARRYRDDTSFVMTEAAWRTMSRHMGVENMSGVAGVTLPPLPTPTVTIGAVMTHDERTGEMTGFTYGGATAAAAGAHAGHGADSARGDTTARPDVLQQLLDLQLRLLSDPVTRARIVADTAARRMMLELVGRMPAEHRAHLEGLLRVIPPAGAEGQSEGYGGTRGRDSDEDRPGRLASAGEGIANAETGEATEIPVERPELANAVLRAQRRDPRIVHSRSRHATSEQSRSERSPVVLAFAQ